MFKLAEFWSSVQGELFPRLEACLPPLTERHRQFILVLEIIRIEERIPRDRGLRLGRPAHDRRCIARAFLAKAFYNLPTTEALWERLQVDEALRRVCGWETRKRVPSQATLSRAFAHWAAEGILDQAHAALTAHFGAGVVFWTVARDSTAIEGRERPGPPSPALTPAPVPPRRRPGRRRKGELPTPKAPSTRLEHQLAAPLSATERLLAELPRQCDKGAKRNSRGDQEAWVGYKFHVDVGDTGVPLFAVTTAASLHDCQVAIPMARTTAQRVTSLYDLMDSAYDAAAIRQASVDLGHQPIIDRNRRRLATLPPMEADRGRLYEARTVAERFNSDLKDNHGGRTVRVRGHRKVHTHLMFGLLTIFAKAVLCWTS